MEDLISVVVPVYNVEKYINRCIESILNQDYTKFELLLIDDGSTDNSGNICEEYKKKDKRIKVVHKKNGGLSDARNAGIDICNGEYITFIDSDDYVDNDYLKVLYKGARNADLVISGIRTVYGNNGTINEKKEIEYIRVSKKETYRRMLVQDVVDVSACAKLYKKDIFKQLRYPVGELYEDFKIIDRVIEQCNSIIITNYTGYNYLQRSTSIMYDGMNEKRMSLIDAADNFKNFIKENYSEIYDAALWRYIYCNFHVLGRAIFDKNYFNEANEIKSNILCHKQGIFKNKYMTIKDRIAVISLIIGLPFYKFMWKTFCIIKNKKIGYFGGMQ